MSPLSAVPYLCREPWDKTLRVSEMGKRGCVSTHPALSGTAWDPWVAGCREGSCDLQGTVTEGPGSHFGSGLAEERSVQGFPKVGKRGLPWGRSRPSGGGPGCSSSSKSSLGGWLLRLCLAYSGGT